MSTILFYTPFNQRSRDTESLIIALRAKGHRVMSLNQTDGLDFHDYLRDQDVEVYSKKYSNPGSKRYYFFQTIYFVYFCWRKKVDVVYSHLEPANLVAVLAQYLVPARVFITRHHADYFNVTNKDGLFTYRFIYRFAKKIIVVSRHAKEFMVAKENIPEHKIIHINLGYDFRLFNAPQPAKQNELKTQMNAAIVLITVGRFISIKRPEISVQLLKALRDKGYSAQLVLLGAGEDEARIRELVNTLGLSKEVFFMGHVTNVLDYISVATYLIHPSISEASCVVTKEAGIVRTPVIACRDVGDFDEYIETGKSGFLVSRDSFVPESLEIIAKYQSDTASLAKIGDTLHNRVFDIFGIEKTIESYHNLSI